MTLKSLALDQLKKLTVTISKPKVWHGVPPAWNVGEKAISEVYVYNSTGCSLRDVVIKTEVWSGARKFQYLWWPNNGFVREMDPGDKYSFLLFMVAQSAGQANIQVTVYADVIPYVGHDLAYRIETIYPA